MFYVNLPLSSADAQAIWIPDKKSRRKAKQHFDLSSLLMQSALASFWRLIAHILSFFAGGREKLPQNEACLVLLCKNVIMNMNIPVDENKIA